MTSLRAQREIAEGVVTHVLKRVAIPDDLARLIYYATLKYAPNVKEPKAFIAGCAATFVMLLNRVTFGPGTFTVPLRDIVNLSHEDILKLYDFPRMERKYQKDEEHVQQCFRTLPYYVPLLYEVPVSVPIRARFEHTYILAGTGGGKTQLMQSLILDDLKEDASVIVMAPKGTLIHNIERLGIPHERLVVVRPEDGIGLNIFDLKGETNSVVELINYIFSSIIGAETTSKQTALLNYSIRLVLASGGTLLTLRQVLRSEKLHEHFIPYVSTLSPSAQEFFATEFGNKKTYGETKDQLIWRIDLLMENSLVAEMFSKEKTDIDMDDIMEHGKVLLIDTSIRKAGEMGSSFIGRFFISLVTLASQERDVTRPLRPVFFYIDEAATYLGENIESILERSRESRVGLTLAHQQMQQLSPSLQASVLTNTSTKYIGSVNEHDARTLAGEMLIDAGTLQHQDPLHFHLKVKGVYKKAVPITVEAGRMETLATHTPPKPVKKAKPVVEKSAPQPTVTPRPKPTHTDSDDELG